MAGTIIFAPWITRAMVRSLPDARFVFGDNTDRVGYGGQAGAMRDEPNAIGVATKRHPGGADADYFSDDDPDALAIIDVDIDLVEAEWLDGRTIYLPRDGLGTGLSQLPERAPRLHQHIVNRFRALVEDGAEFPWGTK